MQIQSSSEAASQCATEISNGANGINDASSGNKDNVSNYNGNNDASMCIDKERQYSQQVASQIQQFVSMIHSVASEFEAVDSSLASNFLVNGLFENSVGSSFLPKTQYFK